MKIEIEQLNGGYLINVPQQEVRQPGRSFWVGPERTVTQADSVLFWVTKYMPEAFPAAHVPRQLAAFRNIIERSQDILASCLPPDGISRDECISQLLSLLDGPEPRGWGIHRYVQPLEDAAEMAANSDSEQEKP